MSLNSTILNSIFCNVGAIASYTQNTPVSCLGTSMTTTTAVRQSVRQSSGVIDPCVCAINIVVILVLVLPTLAPLLQSSPLPPALTPALPPAPPQLPEVPDFDIPDPEPTVITDTDLDRIFPDIPGGTAAEDAACQSSL